MAEKLAAMSESAGKRARSRDLKAALAASPARAKKTTRSAGTPVEATKCKLSEKAAKEWVNGWHFVQRTDEVDKVDGKLVVLSVHGWAHVEKIGYNAGAPRWRCIFVEDRLVDGERVYGRLGQPWLPVVAPKLFDMGDVERNLVTFMEPQTNPLIRAKYPKWQW